MNPGLALRSAITLLALARTACTLLARPGQFPFTWQAVDAHTLVVFSVVLASVVVLSAHTAGYIVFGNTMTALDGVVGLLFAVSILTPIAVLLTALPRVYDAVDDGYVRVRGQGDAAWPARIDVDDRALPVYLPHFPPSAMEFSRSELCYDSSLRPS